MDTDTHRWKVQKRKNLSVSICVHPWLNLIFSQRISGLLRPQFATSKTDTLSLAVLTVLRKHGVPARRRVQRFQQIQSLPQKPAGQLSRAGLDVDIAADPVQV